MPQTSIPATKRLSLSLCDSSPVHKAAVMAAKTIEIPPKKATKADAMPVTDTIGRECSRYPAKRITTMPGKYWPDRLTINKGREKLTKAPKLNSGTIKIGRAKDSSSALNWVKPMRCANTNPTTATTIMVNVGAIRRHTKYTANIANTSPGSSELT